MSISKLVMPKKLYMGSDALGSITEIIKDKENIAFFTDDGIIEAGLSKDVTNLFNENEVNYTVFSGLAPEPTHEDAQKVIDDFLEGDYDLIVALGGGSVIDIAKLTSVVSDKSITVKSLLDDPTKGRKSVETLMIPTTAGTGAEATPNSIISVPEQENKIGIINEAMISDYVVLDSRFTKNLPKHIEAATGIDALCHAIECYTSNKATPISDTFALAAFKLIINNIEEAFFENTEEARLNMLLGSFYAGVAITASGTTGIHALSYPLGGKYHIPHGVSNAILLVPVMKFNKSHLIDKFTVAYDELNLEEEAKTSEEKADWIVNKFDQLVKDLEIPTSLKEYNITKENLEDLVTRSMQVERLLVNNVREITADDARKIYQSII